MVLYNIFSVLREQCGQWLMGDPDRNMADVWEPDCISDASLGSNETLPPGMQVAAGGPLGACCRVPY